jgi:hypothetical protein
MPFKFVGGDALERQKFISEMYLNLAVEPGFRTRSIEYLQVRLQSLCETQIWENVNLYRDPIGYTQNIDVMSWSQSCPKVQFSESTVANYLFSSVSPASSSVIELKVNNPDQYVLWPDEAVTDSLMNEALTFVRLQYRPVSGGEWITAKSQTSSETDKKFNILCDDSRTEGCAFDWDVNNQYEKLLSGYKDGTYELRVKNFCFGGSSLADPSVHEYVSNQILTLTVDTAKPLVKNKVEDHSDRTVSITFGEEIDCSLHDVSITKVFDENCDVASVPVSSTEVAADYLIKCSNSYGVGTWVMQYPVVSGTFEVVVSKVRDVAGNLALNDYKFRFTAMRQSDGLTPQLCSTVSSSSLGDVALTIRRDSASPAPSLSPSIDALGVAKSHGSSTLSKSKIIFASTFAVAILAGIIVVVHRRRRPGHQQSPLAPAAAAEFDASIPFLNDGASIKPSYGAAV